ncbi:trans-sialidase [Trypanosoma cruzi]|nr:trans-sialidase [Trypanosoma cruzi]
MKTKPDAVGTPEARVPAPKGAPHNNHASETFPQSASGLVVVDEARQEDRSAPQRQHSPAQPSGNRKGSAVPRQTSSSDAIGPSTSADTGKWKKRHPAVAYWRLHCLRHRAWSVVRKYLKARYLSAGIALKVAGSTCPPTRQH